ncbi:HlyD family secretion protein [Tundrisphaera sp. TA3]|uniref:HlyD family secretion protein n=1 Tax=Tundrisphaera sp. TA3 TaxID=3435775 RepID=UPI003EB6FCEB
MSGTLIETEGPPATPAPPATRAPARRPRAPRGMHSGSAILLAQTPRAIHRLGRVLALFMLATGVGLAFLPWQQSVPGTGRVVGFAPLDREFRVEAPLYGRVTEWHVREGTRVRGPRTEDGRDVPGDLIATLSNNDPDYLTALEDQAARVREKLQAYRDQYDMYSHIVETMESARQQAIEVARNDVSVGEKKLAAEGRDLEAIRAKYETDAVQMGRIGRLGPQGLASGREHELADLTLRESLAKVRKAEVYVEAAKVELQGKQNKLKEVEAKTLADVAKLRNDAQGASAKVSEGEKELLEIESKVRNQRSQVVRAPRDGVIQRLLVNQGAEQVKDGDPIAVLVPETSEMAVELWLDGNDIPLVNTGDHVRLQFEGWPAVQFVGWPSVAVGSFGGKVALIDPTDNGKGRFRLLVVPEADSAWPSNRYLRQGVRTKGWVLLRQVRLGYEIWRRLNGFPKVVASEEPSEAKGDAKGNAKGSTAEGEDYGGKEKVKLKRPKS